MSTPDLDRSGAIENCCPHHGPLFDHPLWRTPVPARPVEGPFSMVLCGVRVCGVWRGLCGASGALSLSGGS